MNYLIRARDLHMAINAAFEGNKGEKWKAEWDRLKELYDGMIMEYSGIAVDSVSRLFGSEEEIPKDRPGRIIAYMTDINIMCVKYDVEPVFPEVADHEDRKEILDAVETYLDQVRELDMLLRKPYEEACRTGNFEDYFRQADLLEEEIDVILEKKRKEEEG